MQKKLEANIPKYYLFRIVAKRLVIPIITIYLLRNNLSISQIGILAAIGSITTLIFEVPSGLIADNIGLKKTLVLTFCFWFSSMLLYTIGGSFLWFAAGAVLYSLGGAFYSGTHHAFLYETLSQLGREEEYKKISGRAIMISQASSFVFLLIIPIIAEWNMQVPFYLNLCFFLIGIFIALSFQQTNSDEAKKKLQLFESFEPQKLKVAWGLIRNNKNLYLTIIFFSILQAAQYLVSDFRQVFLNNIGIQLVWFGLVYSAIRLLTSISSGLAYRIEAILKQKGMLWLIVLLVLMTLGGFGLFKAQWAVVFAVLIGIADGLKRPIEQELINKQTQSSNRVTVFSIKALSSSALHFVLAPVLGFLIDNISFSLPFLVIAVVVPLSLGLILVSSNSFTKIGYIERK